MGRNIFHFLLLSLLAVSCLPSQTDMPRTTPAAANGFLRVQGRHIVNASGRPILLRGVNMDTYYYGYVWGTSPWEYATQEDIQFLERLGVTVIRLGLHWRYFDTSLGFDLIDAYLDWCEQAGIYVILDMHVVPPEDDILEGKMWNDPAAQQKFLDLWAAIAARYADRTIIAGYDIYNEPAPPHASQWWSLVERARAAIRAVDANHILFIENPLIEDGGFHLMADPNVVYSFHDYEPFLVSHAGAEWVGDSPIPVDYSYPGAVLVNLEWADWSEDAAVLTSQASEWVYWDSGVLTVPSGVEFATLKPAADGDVGEVWFDDLEVEHNGVPQTIYNPGIEDASNADASRPAHWSFWSDSGFSGEWSSEQAHGGTHSLKISGDGNGLGIWTQSEWVFTAPLFRVQPGDTFRLRGWVYAPRNHGNISLGMDYLNGIYKTYDRARLLANMQPYLRWASANHVPLYVGEFGAMATAPGDSRYRLAIDKIGVMNEAGLHWTMWTYREPARDRQEFGLYFGNDLDERLADILRQSLSMQNGHSFLHR